MTTSTFEDTPYIRGVWGCSSSLPASSSPFTSLILYFSPVLASAAVWRFSASRSAPSPSWLLPQPEGFPLLIHPHLHLGLCGNPRALCLGCTVGLKCIVKLGLVGVLTLVLPRRLLPRRLLPRLGSYPYPYLVYA